jgi:hypothetical protein
MATPSDIAQVRLNTNEPDDVDPYTDAYISALIDSGDVAGATLTIWQAKAATIAATAVDITEADATHKMSDKFDHANAMIKYWRGVTNPVIVGVTDPNDRSVRVRVIQRTD